MTHWQLQRPSAAPRPARAASPRPHCAQRAEGGFQAIHIRRSQPKAAGTFTTQIAALCHGEVPAPPRPADEGGQPDEGVGGCSPMPEQMVALASLTLTQPKPKHKP